MLLGPNRALPEWPAGANGGKHEGGSRHISESASILHHPAPQQRAQHTRIENQLFRTDGQVSCLENALQHSKTP